MALTEVTFSKETKKGPGRGRTPRWMKDVPRPPVASRVIDTPAPPSVHVTRDVEVHKPAMEPAMAQRSFWRTRGKFAAGVGGATAAVTGAAVLHHHHSKEKQMAGVAKFDQSGPKSQYSTGRTLATQFAPGLHGAVAGKKGRKLEAATREYAPAAAIGIPASIAASHLMARGKIGASLATSLGGQALARTGIHAGMRRNQRKGAYKPVEKMEHTVVKSLHNPFDGQDYEVSKLSGENGPITNLRLVPTATTLPNATHGLDLVRIRNKRKLPLRNETLKIRGGHGSTGQATGDAASGHRVVSNKVSGRGGKRMG